LRAVGNFDPFGNAAVMSRGIVGDRKGEPTVASPLLKQVFSLNTGVCMDDESQRLPVYDVRVADGIVQVRPSGEGAPA
jgi:nitrite reductase (NADH) small subunit